MSTGDLTYEKGTVPRIGMLATVRNRRGIVASVEPFDDPTEGRLHLVRVEYTDADGNLEDTIVWEREPKRELIEPTALPSVESDPPMPGRDFDALVRAVRWSALTPYVTPEGSLIDPDSTIASPLFGAIQVEDFQLVPLLKALHMPRVSLLLADDVGLGKTIEAGLVLTELIMKRRIRRVLILCPASLRQQWKQEMEEKFSLSFDIIDRGETHALQKRLGLDANPWRTYPRIIASYHYLRQPDILEQFRAACRQPEGTAQLPWDLLIVDEAHNLMPSNFGDDSDLAKMLREISPWFEHKLFLTATPHNGHTRCFSGLLEQLDPVRFTQTSEFTDAEKKRVKQTVMRRLKSEINELDDSLKRPRRFPERYPQPIPLWFGAKEKKLINAFEKFRQAVKTAIRRSSKTEQLAGVFAVEVLNKRLLSCPYTLAESWSRLKEGLREQEAAEAAEVAAARRASEEDIDDDREREGRAQHAAKTIGAWLKPLSEAVSEKIEAIDAALSELGLTMSADSIDSPQEDTRLDRLLDLIGQHLRQDREWVDNERLIVFTEYKTTLDYLESRLRDRFRDSGERIRVLYGGMGETQRNEIKEAFNDPSDPVRVLVATDAASEGLNLQQTARLLLHYEIPWNPSRLDQRNGRLDRHGQARDVTVFHFTSEEDADLKFLGYVVGKAHNIREDLGSMGEIFDAAFQRRFVDLEDTDRVTQDLDADLETCRGQAKIETGETPSGVDQVQDISKFREEIDLSPDTLRNTLEVALGIGLDHEPLAGPDEKARFNVVLPLPRWESLIDDYLRIRTKMETLGRLPKIIFDPQKFVQKVGERPIFRPAKDTKLLHLGHPMFRHALAVFSRARFPGAGGDFSASRWTVRHGAVPQDCEALVLLTIEEMATNELREPFHHWVYTMRFPVQNSRLQEPLPYTPPNQDTLTTSNVGQEGKQKALSLWDEVRLELRDFLKCHAEQVTGKVQQKLKQGKEQALKNEKDHFEARLKEVEAALKDTTRRKLEKERDTLLQKRRQLKLYVELTRAEEERLREIEDELQRRSSHYQDLLNYLREEQQRVIERLIPRRYEMRDQVRVFPIAVEIRLPQVVH
ncbi:DISARM system SNF2-like helicase DrmD [Acidobacteria bacterium AH-259-L09]|nr:DISARM system SNF2-like helicase DrmD [Acidobacteria bacterium AH-259-L09]